MRPLLGICVLIASISSPSAAREDWILTKEQHGVSAYTRSVEDSKLKAFRGEMEIDASMDALIAIVCDVESWSVWMPDVAEARLMERTEQFQTHYLKSELPWPVKDRDGIYRFDYETSEDGLGIHRLTMSTLPDAVPTVKGVIRIPAATGFWQFTEITPTRTRVAYEAHVDPGGEMPRWLINRMIASTPIDTLRGLATEADRRGSESSM